MATSPKRAKVKKRMDRFTCPWEDSDITFIVEEEEFHCHSLVLKLNSPVLAAMFNGNFREGIEKKVNLPGKKSSHFSAFLTFMYPLHDYDDTTTSRNILSSVLSYAKEYQCTCVTLHVDKLLAIRIYGKNVPVNVDTALYDLRLSELYELKEVRRLSIKFLVDFEGCDEYPEKYFQSLSTESKYKILTGKILKLTSNSSCKYNQGSKRYEIHVSNVASVDLTWQLLENISSEGMIEV